MNQRMNELESQKIPGGAEPILDVSVVVPTYNNARKLPACLDALLQQDLSPDCYEILVVDDGSSDDTLHVLNSYASKAPNLRYLHQPNAGPAAARNQGARKARGRVLMFTDDDCVVQPDWIRQMRCPIVQSEGLVVGVKGAYRTRQTSPVARFAQREFEDRYRKLLTSEHIDFVDTYSAAFDRQVFLSLGGFDTSFRTANNEDTEFSYRMAEAGYRMAFNPEAIVYHTHPDTLVKYLKVKFSRAYWRMVVYRSFPDKMRSDSYTPQLLKVQIAMVFLSIVAFAGSFLSRHFLHVGIAALALCLVSTIPFCLQIINGALYDRIDAFMRKLIKRGYIRALIQRLAAWFEHSTLRTVCLKATRLANRAAQSLFRAMAKTIGFFWSHALRPTGLVVTTCVRTTTRRVSQLVGSVVLLTGRSFSHATRSIRSAAKKLGTTRFGKMIARGWRACTRTRLFEVPYSLFMVILRAITMGLGILWGLRPRHDSRDRFSEVVALVFADIVSLFLACHAAIYTYYWLRELVGHPHMPIIGTLRYVPMATVFLLATFVLTGLYRPRRGVSLIGEFSLLVRSTFMAAILLVILVGFSGGLMRRDMVFLGFAYTVLLTWLLRNIVHTIFAIIRSGQGDIKTLRVLIVGTNEIGRVLCQRLQSRGIRRPSVVGFITTDTHLVGSTIEGVEVLGSLAELGTMIDHHQIDDVFVAVFDLPSEDVIEMINEHAENRDGVGFHIVSNSFDLVTAELEMASGESIPIASLRNEKMNLVQMLIKRLLDLTISLAAVIATLPVWVAIVAAIRAETKGPAFFRQERVGKNGKLFRICKFRTMHCETNAFELSPSTPHDRRVTRVGAFLRRTSLDELPQFINVIKGEMSLVGPRPEMSFIVDKYRSWERQRLKVKPGITGLWQIMGRKDLPLHENIEYDFYYIKNQSLLLDLTILVRTIPVILMRKGAY